MRRRKGITMTDVEKKTCQWKRVPARVRTSYHDAMITGLPVIEQCSPIARVTAVRVPTCKAHGFKEMNLSLCAKHFHKLEMWRRNNNYDRPHLKTAFAVVNASVFVIERRTWQGL